MNHLEEGKLGCGKEMGRGKGNGKGGEEVTLAF